LYLPFILTFFLTGLLPFASGSSPRLRLEENGYSKRLDDACLLFGQCPFATGRMAG